MPILYELCGADPQRVFSPYAWRVRLVLGFKAIAFESRPLAFTQIPQVLGAISKTVPVLVDGDATLGESFDICAYLETAYPQTPSIFGGQAGQADAALIDNLIVTGLGPAISRMIIRDIHDQLAPDDAAYFRASREKRFGMTLEDVQRGRDKERGQFATLLKPYRRRLEQGPYLGGARLAYADLALASCFCWAKATSAYDTLHGDDLFEDWLARVLEGCKQTQALKLAT